jgi:hypothetical protein
MSLISYIENLRTKPESERKKIAVGVTVVVTVFIFTLWAFTTISSISNRTSPVATESDSSTGKYDDVKKSWDSLIEGMSGFFSDFSTTPTAPTEDEGMYFDAMEGIPADVVDATTTDTV